MERKEEKIRKKEKKKKQEKEEKRSTSWRSDTIDRMQKVKWMIEYDHKRHRLLSIFTCVVAGISRASCRCRRCAQSSLATAYVRTVANRVARWIAAYFSRAGDKTRRRLCARGRPYQPSWPSFRREIAATGWTALFPRSRWPAWWRLPIPPPFCTTATRCDQSILCPPCIRGRTWRATTTTTTATGDSDAIYDTPNIALSSYDSTDKTFHRSDRRFSSLFCRLLIQTRHLSWIRDC